MALIRFPFPVPLWELMEDGYTIPEGDRILDPVHSSFKTLGDDSRVPPTVARSQRERWGLPALPRSLRL